MSMDKKTNIYEATLSLIYENSDLSSIKVADIATRANIGKGTVYEYFESKEQIIGEALIYMLNKGIDSLAPLLNNVEDFKESYFLMLNSFCSLLRQNKNLYNLITTNPNNLVMHTTIQGILTSQMKELRQAYFRIVEGLVDKSVQEGILRAKPSKFDWQTAVLCSITCVFFHKQFKDEFDSLGDDEVLEKAYTAYLKLLS